MTYDLIFNLIYIYYDSLVAVISNLRHNLITFLTTIPDFIFNLRSSSVILPRLSCNEGKNTPLY